MSGEINHRAEIKSVLGELTEWAYLDGIQAIACVMVDRDGDLQTRIVFGQGAKLPLLAGITVLSRDMLGQLSQRPSKSPDGIKP